MVAVTVPNTANKMRSRWSYEIDKRFFLHHHRIKKMVVCQEGWKDYEFFIQKIDKTKIGDEYERKQRRGIDDLLGSGMVGVTSLLKHTLIPAIKLLLFPIQKFFLMYLSYSKFHKLFFGRYAVVVPASKFIVFVYRLF